MERAIRGEALARFAGKCQMPSQRDVLEGAAKYVPAPSVRRFVVAGQHLSFVPKLKNSITRAK
jgi:hypothetical protein